MQEQCIGRALECAMTELNGTVRAECTGHIRINNGFKTLKDSLCQWNAKHHTQVSMVPHHQANSVSAVA